MFHKIFQKTNAEETFPNLVYAVSINLKPKPEKDIMRNGNYRPIYLMNIDAHILNTILAKLNPIMYKKNYTL